MSVNTFTKSGSRSTTLTKLDSHIFGIDVKNHDGLKQAYVAYLSNGRTSAASTKTRGEVRGGGRKPWRQKGTGRARFGSIRTPIWRGGGITFGPTGEENYTKKINSKAKKQYVRQALSLKAKGNSVIVLEEFVNKNGKVRETVMLLNKIGANKKVLFVIDLKNALSDRATSNIVNLKVVSPAYLNVYDVLNADSIVITSKSLEIISTWLGGKK